jgi:hypothetical protein
VDELLMGLYRANESDMTYRKLTTRGYLMKIRNGGDEATSINFETDLYTSINKYFKNKKNIHQVYLELYQKDRLNDILPYITSHYTDIVRRINMSLKTLAKEILNIYFMTRNHKNDKLYDSLPKIYKDTLFNLHKVFIVKRDEDMHNADEMGLIEKRSLTVDNVYGYLKGLNALNLVKVYLDRNKLLVDIKNITELNDESHNELSEIMDDNCINTFTQSTLME